LFHSPNLPALKHLHLHASDLGDDGCGEIVESGILQRLETLDLRHGCITDEGAATLASSPDITRLELLNLDNNQLTEEGEEELKSLGINVRCDNQSDVGSHDFLYTSDME